MDRFPRLPAYLRSERALVGALAVVALLPVVYTLVCAFSVARDVAYWDELGTVLLFLLRLDHGSNWQDTLSQLFALGNEHRTFTSRLLFALSYWFTGTVNFVVIGVIGNLFICGLCGLLVYYAGTTARRIRLGLVLGFLLFQLEHYENFQWSGSSIDHFQVVLLAAASIVGLARGSRVGWLVALLFAFLASFTLAHGLVVWAVGALMLAYGRSWARLGGWLFVGALTGLVFFYGFEFNPGHRIDVQHIAMLGRIIHYWLALLGAPLALGEDAAEPFLGILLLALWGRALSRGAFTREPIVLPLSLWAVGSLLLVAIGRTEVAQGHVYSRYYVLGALAWALIIFLQLEERHTEARPYHSLRWLVPLLVLFNVTANARFAHNAQSWVICRDNAADYYMRYGKDGVGRFTLHPDPVYATQLIREVEESGIYRMPRLCQQRWFPQARPAASLAYFVDRISVADELISIEGWAARGGVVSKPGEVHLILQSKQSQQIFTTLPVDRADVAAVHSTENWKQSGFQFLRRRWLLPAEDFQIGLLIYSQGRAEFIMTAHHLDMTGRGVGVLANAD